MRKRLGGLDWRLFALIAAIVIGLCLCVCVALMWTFRRRDGPPLNSSVAIMRMHSQVKLATPLTRELVPPLYSPCLSCCPPRHASSAAGQAD